MANNSESQTTVPPYVSFKTFLSGIQALRDHGLPPEIDRSAWASKSGADQSTLLSAFKFLGLLDMSGATQKVLHDLVATEPNTPEEQSLLGTILRQQYTKVFDLDLTTATPNQVSDAIGSYGPTGSTKDRAYRFFLKAAEYGGVAVSGRLLKGAKGTAASVNGGTTKTRRRGKRKAPPVVDSPPDDSSQGTAFKTVDLPNAGGRLTLSGTFNTFELDGDERDLVFGVIDQMKAFDKKAPEEES